VFVTHDQEEAMTMSDRIAVFNQGKIEQIGTPAQIYEYPQTEFVATFVGTSNIFKGERAAKYAERAGTFALRPEKIQLLDAIDILPMDSAFVEGTIREVFYLGMSTRYVVDLDDGGDLIVQEQNGQQSIENATRGRRVTLLWKHNDMRELNG
jgi:putative spermidine/putrescine transport system ATP-binding protein